MCYINNFIALQAGFSIILIYRIPFSGSFKVEVAENGTSWTSELPLVVSFYVPAWILLLGARDSIVTFGLKITLQSIVAFLSQLGLSLKVLLVVVMSGT